MSSDGFCPLPPPSVSPCSPPSPRGRAGARGQAPRVHRHALGEGSGRSIRPSSRDAQAAHPPARQGRQGGDGPRRRSKRRQARYRYGNAAHRLLRQDDHGGGAQVAKDPSVASVRVAREFRIAGETSRRHQARQGGPGPPRPRRQRQCRGHRHRHRSGQGRRHADRFGTQSSTSRAASTATTTTPRSPPKTRLPGLVG